MKRAPLSLWLTFTGVPLAFAFAVLVLPALQGVRTSFDSCGPSLDNYSTILHDRMFWEALANNLIVPLGSLALELIAGLGLALLLTSKPHASPLLEASAILPFAMPEIVCLAIARFGLGPRGYVNAALAGVGVNPLPWLAPGRALSLLSVMVVDAWHVTPVVMLMLIAGLQTIPDELYEAARLDGAGPIKTFRYVTLPMLAPAIVAAVVLRGVDALRIFSTALVLTGAEGVPVLSTYAYELWSDAREPAVAMAASVILAALVTVVGFAGMGLLRVVGLKELPA